MTIKKADWEAWLDNPVTQGFFSAIAERRDGAKAYWDRESWDGEDIWLEDKAYPLRVECRAMYEMAQGILDITLEEEDNVESERDIPD